MSNANLPAFAVLFDGAMPECGLTKRELFAAMAMQGLLANSEINEYVGKLASMAINQADALLAKLEEKPPPAAK